MITHPGRANSGSPAPACAAGVAPLWTPAPVLGTALTLLGILTTHVAQISMGRSWRIGVRADDPTTLVVHGPFAVVRNPIFSCMLATSTGMTLLLPNALSLASIIALVVAIELQVRLVEEPHLLRTHGQSYRDYAATVGRFVPGLGRLA